MIEGEDIVKLGENYLVDIPVQEKPDSVYVFFLNANIPVERLKSLIASTLLLMSLY